MTSIQAMIMIKLRKATMNYSFTSKKAAKPGRVMKPSYLPRFDVVEVSAEVDEAKAFALPPADFKQVPDTAMRNFANKLMAKR